MGRKYLTVKHTKEYCDIKCDRVQKSNVEVLLLAICNFYSFLKIKKCVCVSTESPNSHYIHNEDFFNH